MGIVYKARHRRMDRTVALKVLDAKIIPSPEALRRFRREVQAAARLHHPNVVLAYDASEDAGRHYLVMEYVDGTNLRRQVRDAGPLPVHEAIDCILQAARGLEYAHSQRVIHRDIKPDNLLRDSQGRVRILDLGLARLGDRMASGAATITSTGSLMGTLEFMAPEQARDAHAADHRADVYSLGCTLHHLLTGRPPYSGESMYEKLSAHQEQPIPSLAAARPDVPPALDGLFRRMLAKEPEDRFQSMTEVIAALEALGSAPQDTSHRKGQTREPSEASDVVATAPRASSGVGDASPGASPRPRPSKPTPPSRWLTPSRRFAPPPAMLLGGVLVVLAALVLWLLFR
jgi:serine/threonine protein kinase